MSFFCALCYQLDGNGDGEPGVLMTAQTITSESLCTTTTTHITKVQTVANTHVCITISQSTLTVTFKITFVLVSHDIRVFTVSGCNVNCTCGVMVRYLY